MQADNHSHAITYAYASNHVTDCFSHYRMSWGMLFFSSLLTNRICLMQWMLQKSQTSLVSTLFANGTGKYMLAVFICKPRFSFTKRQSNCFYPFSHLVKFNCYSRYIQSTCATSGEGLYEGLDWLSNNIASKVKSHCNRHLPEYIHHSNNNKA